MVCLLFRPISLIVPRSAIDNFELVEVDWALVSVVDLKGMSSLKSPNVVEARGARDSKVGNELPGLCCTN